VQAGVIVPSVLKAAILRGWPVQRLTPHLHAKQQTQDGRSFGPAESRTHPTFRVMVMSGHKSVRGAFRYYPVDIVTCPRLDLLPQETDS
jgi:hypothetical protein